MCNSLHEHHFFLYLMNFELIFEFEFTNTLLTTQCFIIDSETYCAIFKKFKHCIE